MSHAVNCWSLIIGLWPRWWRQTIYTVYVSLISLSQEPTQFFPFSCNNVPQNSTGHSSVTLLPQCCFGASFIWLHIPPDVFQEQSVACFGHFFLCASTVSKFTPELNSFPFVSKDQESVQSVLFWKLTRPLWPAWSAVWHVFSFSAEFRDASEIGCCSSQSLFRVGTITSLRHGAARTLCLI